MNIEKKEIDALNAELIVRIEKSDYSDKVEQVLKTYKKKAKIDGFRSGFAPMGLIKKQFETPVRLEEINKILQKSVNEYIVNEKLDILGQPLPKQQDKINWDQDELIFEFEVGLSPEIKLDLSKVKVEYLKITPTDEQIEKFVENYRLNFGEKINLEQIERKSDLAIQLKSKQNHVFNQVVYINSAELSNESQLIGKKTGDVIAINPVEWFENESKFASFLGKSIEESSELFQMELEITIQEISKKNLAELNSELFDKIFPDDSIDSEIAFKNKIKEDVEEVYQTDSDRLFYNEVIAELIKTTHFSLPDSFLEKWIRYSGETVKSEEDAKVAYQNSREGIIYELIQQQIVNDNELKASYQEVRDFSLKQLKSQMAMYGQFSFGQEQLEGIVDKALKKREEYEKMAQQTFSAKLLDWYKQNIVIKIREVNYDEFVRLITEKSQNIKQE